MKAFSISQRLLNTLTRLLSIRKKAGSRLVACIDRSGGRPLLDPQFEKPQHTLWIIHIMFKPNNVFLSWEASAPVFVTQLTECLNLIHQSVELYLLTASVLSTFCHSAVCSRCWYWVLMVEHFHFKRTLVPLGWLMTLGKPYRVLSVLSRARHVSTFDFFLISKLVWVLVYCGLVDPCAFFCFCLFYISWC